MQVYADIIQALEGSAKIDMFCECVEILNFEDEEIRKFAQLCDFPTVEGVFNGQKK